MSQRTCSRCQGTYNEIAFRRNGGGRRRSICRLFEIGGSDTDNIEYTQTCGGSDTGIAGSALAVALAVIVGFSQVPWVTIARIPAAGECRLFTALVMLPTSFSGTTYTQRRGWRPPTVAQYERFRLADCFFDGEDS